MFDLDSPQTQRELQAMEEVGRLRSRALGIAFGVSWIGVTVVLMVLRVTGLIWCGIIGAAIGGAIAKSYVAGETANIIERVRKKYDLPKEALARDKYIID
jgi:hypothetical protein